VQGGIDGFERISEWAKRAPGISIHYLSFHSFFFSFCLLSCRQQWQSGVELWAGNGILGDNDLYALGLLHARVFIQKTIWQELNIDEL
jgi:hypothetical protein